MYIPERNEQGEIVALVDDSSPVEPEPKVSKRNKFINCWIVRKTILSTVAISFWIRGILYTALVYPIYLIKDVIRG